MALPGKWKKTIQSDGTHTWELMYKRQSQATVWMNGTWGTWDKNGTGGENCRENNLGDALMKAHFSALVQGFLE